MTAAARCLVVALVVLGAAACWRERRPVRGLPAAEAPRAEEMSPLVPGPGGARAASSHPYLSNAYAIAAGKRLYSWYNCVGCHSHGGGGMGPPLMDGRWIYGAEPGQIFASIAEGRPNGMPAFGSRIPADQVWQIVAYVRSMSGHVRRDAAPGRADEMQVTEPETMREELPLRGSGPGTP